VEIDHLGIAVTDLATALPRWEHALGGAASPPEEVADQHVRAAFLEVGATHLEFLEPVGPDAPLRRFLERRGEGLHHLAFRVPSVDRQLAELAAQGARLVDAVARPGARGRRVGFAHPSAFGGVLVEFVEVRR
jgi:methylmalonyl-CoA/ethylmalonyl-CoA epimerase